MPHVGWNDTIIKESSRLFENIKSGNDFYYVHSYCFIPENGDHVSAFTDYDCEIVAAVEKDWVFGTQFHPEKSSEVGFKLLENFEIYNRC